MSQFQAAATAYQTGRIQEAESQLRGLLQSMPTHVESHFVLGMLLGRTGRWSEALSHLEKVVLAQPTRHEALYWVAVAHKVLGDPFEAAAMFERALIYDPQNPTVLNELGLCHLAMNRPDLAMQAFSKAIASDPFAAMYRFNSGLALKLLDELYKARDAFQEAIRLEPRRVESYLELSSLLVTLGQFQDNLALLSNALEIHPPDPRLLLALAGANSLVGNSQKAEELYRNTMAEYPASGIAFGERLQEEGRFEESVSCLLTSLHAMPFQGHAFYLLAQAKTFEADGQSWIGLAEPLVDSAELDLKEKTYLCYALARAYERQGDAEKTIHFFDMANALAFTLHNQRRSFNRAERKQANDELIARYSAKELVAPLEGASDSDQPIFIVGMIRSGTTLLDQIISSHPDVRSAGESNFWMKEADRIRRMRIQSLSKEGVQGIAQSYLSSIESIAGTSRHISDKMPLNFLNLGLIHQVFPKAKIIHLRRDPLDTCFSIYTTYFGQGPTFAYSQSNIVFFYREYLRLMRHWRAALPSGVMLEVDYESLVEDREGTTRQVLDFCGIAWSDACLSHENNESSIRTPSVWQARQPIYKSSIHRWQPYEKWLSGLLELKTLSHRQ